ncbi:MAG TPA: hypothetical protein VFV49_12475, partial [Thermoanaerobaculia bacterium]|nr:hypothetical protein [Thermoanaerobaculia bacterium]
ESAPEVAVEYGAPKQDLFGSVSGGSGSLVAWHERSTPTGPWSIYATRLDRNARVLDPESLFLGSSSCAEIAPAVATDGRDYLTAWYDDHQVVVASVGADGTFRKTHVVENLAMRCDARPLGLVSNGTDYLLVWRMKDPAKDTLRLVGLRLRADGSAIDAAPFTIDALTTDEAYVWRAASNGQDYLVAWDYKAARVTSDGAVLDRHPGLIQLGAGSLGELWWNGTSYLAEMYADAGGVRFLRIASDGTGGRPRNGPQPAVTPWPSYARGDFPTSMACNARGCTGAMVKSEDYGSSAVTMLRFHDDGTNITISAQPTDFTYHDADDRYESHPTAVIHSGRMALLYLARPTARPYSNVRRLFVAAEVPPRARAVRH